MAIVARQENPKHYDCHYGVCRYTSARLNTAYKVMFTHGRVEARMVSQAGRGLARLLAWSDRRTTWGTGRSGEIDIMEHIGKTPRAVYGTLHGPGYYGDKGYQQAAHVQPDTRRRLSGQYAIDWQADAIRWYVDFDRFDTRQRRQFRCRYEPLGLTDHKFEPRKTKWDIEVGNHNATTRFPQTMLVDYVRVYRLDV